jgi:predicted nuclease of predicted toxin-antitoxin system
MKLLFDENISYRILKMVLEAYPDSSHAKTEKLMHVDDKNVWEFAKKNNFTIVTNDSDFNDLNILRGFPPKIIWLRIGNTSTQNIAKMLIEKQTEINAFISDSENGILYIRE